MFGVAKRFWIPMVIVIVVAVAAVTVSRLHSVFGSHQHAPDTGNLDLIIAFYPSMFSTRSSARQGRSPASITWMPMPSRMRSSMPRSRGHLPS